VRTALTVLIIVALALVAVGAVNHAVTLDLDFLVLSLTGVSVFWLTLVFAAIVVVAGVAAAWAARGAATAAQRRLEKELAKTYKRLREAQAGGDLTAVADVAVVGATVTALAPPPPEAAALDAAAGPGESGTADPAGEPGLAEVTAVTAVVAPVAEEWGAPEAGTAVDEQEAADVPAEVVGVVLAAGPEAVDPAAPRDEPVSGEDETLVAASVPHVDDAGAADEVTGVTEVAPVRGDGAPDGPAGDEVAPVAETGAKEAGAAAPQPAAGDASAAGPDGPPQVS
jgi:hypothetical protein